MRIVNEPIPGGCVIAQGAALGCLTQLAIAPAFKLCDVGCGEVLQIALTEVGQDVASQAAPVVLSRAVLAGVCLNLLGKFSEQARTQVCYRLCAVCEPQVLSKAHLVIAQAGLGNGIFKAQTVGAEPTPSARSQTKAALVASRAAATVDDEFTVAQS